MNNSRYFKELAFVLTNVPYRDNDLIVNLLSEDSGKLSTAVYRGRSINKSSTFLYQPGDLIELEYEKFENRDFIKILNTNGSKLLNFEKFSYQRFVFHSFLIEAITKISRPELPADHLYKILFSNLLFSESESNLVAFISWNLWKIISDGGYQIDFSVCENCSKETWRENDTNVPVFRKQDYSLIINKGRLRCGDCRDASETSFSVTPSMIKVLWNYERTRRYTTYLDSFPNDVLIPLALALSQYLLTSYDIKVNSFEPFIQLLKSIKAD